MKKLKHIMKNLIITLMCVISLSSAILSITVSANAGAYYVQLGSNAALGSPVLNENFVTDDWNKWELIVWGTFLSNFCVPLIDDYKSALIPNSGSGSNGAGYKALCFGTGNDSNNNETIKELTDYAVNVQKTSMQTVYVSYTYVERDNIIAQADPNNYTGNGKVIREANFNDFVMVEWAWREDYHDKKEIDENYKDAINSTNVKGNKKDDSNEDQKHLINLVSGDTADVSKLKSIYNSYVISESEYLYDSEYDLTAMAGTIPTFWIKGSDSKYIKVFDFMDPWDIQIASCLVSKASSDSSMKSNFMTAYKNAMGGKKKVCMDFFGNLVLDDGKMVIQSASNQNLTKDKKINLVNSFIMNNTYQDLSADRILKNARQYVNEKAFHIEFGGINAALPALSGSTTKLGSGSTYIYYDSDCATIKVGENGHYGKALTDFLDAAKIELETQKFNLKVEVVNPISDNFWGLSTETKDTDSGAMACHMMAASIMSTWLNDDKQKPEILDQILMIDGSKVDLFEKNPIAVPVAIKNDNKELANRTREMYNFFYQCYSGAVKDSTAGSFSHSELKTNVREHVKCGEDLGKLLAGELVEGYGDNLWEVFKDVNCIPEDDKYTFNDSWDYGDNESFSDEASRMIILYPASDVFASVSAILGLKEGTDFSIYSPYIYVTYLDFYGVDGSVKLNGSMNHTSDFKEELYKELKDTQITEILTETKSEKDMEKEVLNYSYLMLSPTSGRSYRSKLVATGFTDFIYDQYLRIVYGTKADDTASLSTTSKSNSGFLHVDNYGDNFLTKWFIDDYANVAMWIIMAAVIAMVPLGLIRGKKPVWFLVTAFTVINTVMLMPSFGEIIPYFSSEMVQSLFTSKMTYWSISQAVTNASMESDAATQSNDLEGLSANEASQVAKLVKSLSVVYLDRSLMLKRDVSAKTIQKVEGKYTEIQNMKSARWLLPLIMRQYSQDNKGADYVYVQIGDLLDDLSNLYWYYDPDDATLTTNIKPTMTSMQNEKATKHEDLFNYYTNVVNGNKFIDYVDLYQYDDSSDIKFQSYAYEKSIGQAGTNNVGQNLYYTYNYILEDLPVPSRKSYTKSESYSGIEDLDKYVKDITETNKVDKSIVINLAEKLEDIADEYDRNSRDSMQQEYGYLWATENQAHYFYGNIKATMGDDISTGAIIGRLQGQIKEDKYGKEVRDNFMFAKETITEDGEEVEYPTGYIRDLLDLQSLFTNYVPYLYQVQLITGGTDGNGGLLTEEVTYNSGKTGQYTVIEPIKIDEYHVYKGVNQSWLFRSNWVVKLLESPEYNKTVTVKDANGKKYKVKNPLLPECYPEERPMVFSQAQMEAYNLKEADLNLVELKCLEVNKQVVDKWTLMINYAGTEGITLEIIERQMAIDAMLIFNDVFSPSTAFSSSRDMYPQTLDLRNISFDSVMKMLMINVSKNTSYIYGDTMGTLIESTDLFTAFLLLTDAFLCASVIPFIRNVLMAAIFYLGFVAILKALFSSPKYKAKIACGQLISNVLFLFITMCYYLVFFALINLTASDDVLTVSSVQVTAGNPVWCLIVVLIASIAYVAFMLWQLNFCWKNYRDMGVEMYSSMMHNVVGKLKNSINGLKSDIKNKGETSNSESSSGDGGLSTGKNGKGSGSGSGGTGGIGRMIGGNGDGDSLSIEPEIEISLGGDKNTPEDIYSNYSGLNATEQDRQILDEINSSIRAGEASMEAAQAAETVNNAAQAVEAASTAADNMSAIGQAVETAAEVASNIPL